MPRTICMLPEFQGSSLLNCNDLKRILTFGRPKYRLFLLCEGHGDGTGVHFLDTDKHQGYKLETVIADHLIKKNVYWLRFGLQVRLIFPLADKCKHNKKSILYVCGN